MLVEDVVALELGLGLRVWVVGLYNLEDFAVLWTFLEGLAINWLQAL